MNKILYIAILLITIPLISWGQESVKVLTEEQLVWFLENYHPISVQGNLLAEKGESTIRKSKGAFDPYVHGDLDQKYFDDKTYYSVLNAGLKVPTWYGVELKTGIDQNSGVFLNPEDNVPSGGLWYAGLSVPLGKGLFIDKRRASLKQAKIYAQSTKAEQQKLMNDLYFDAIKQYWKWTDAWNQYQIYQESILLAETRFEAVKTSYTFGDKPAIDTLEAFIQVQNRQMSLNESLLTYQNATLELSNFLWFENNTPLVITDELRPLTINEVSLTTIASFNTLDDLLIRLEEKHPDMQLYDFKLDAMDIDKRLKIEGLKPKINLNYNTLNEPTGADFLTGISPQNYKWGVTFSLPLFLREQRGDLQITRLKIKETELGQQQKLLELQNKVRTYFNEQSILQDQVTLNSNTADNYGALLIGERKKFSSGESSLFLVNSRETKFIQARLKVVELTSKYKIAQTGLIWATGKLYENE